MKSIESYWGSINIPVLLLLPLSGLYCLLSVFRKTLYRIGLLKSYRAPVPVLIVGNITVGGTGKTPLIIYLVKQLLEQGRKPGVISRGYGGQSEHWPVKLTQQTTAYQVGDEPQLIFLRTGCPVVVGADRKADIELLLSESDCDIILADDGMQHYALQRDIEIAVVDAQRKLGNGLCLPSGPLRETSSRLNSVDLVLLNGGSPQQQSYHMQPASCYAVSATQSVNVGLSNFKGKTVHAVAGIGHPERFFEMLEQQGISVIRHHFADHHQFTQDELCFDDEYSVLMTEKDAVKCNDFTLSDHWAVPIEIVLSESAEKSIESIFDLLLTKPNRKLE